MKKKVLLWVHIIYWLYTMFFVEFLSKLAYKNQLVRPDPNAIFFSNIILFAAVFYLSYCILLPVFFRKRKFITLVGSWFVLSGLFVGTRFLVQEYLFLKWWGICNYCYEDYSVQGGAYIFGNAMLCFSHIILPGAIIWFVDNWLKSEHQRLRLQEEKVAAEKAFLQSQVSPHFLFNCLNNIYSMVYHQSENSLPAIQKLSGMMRYVIADGSAEEIPLNNEINYLQDYIELQQYRSRNTALRFELSGGTSGKYIAPLILISFVENVFKHGVVTDPAHPVYIQLKTTGSQLSFTVRNKINRHTKDPVSGIGLRNVQNRLALQYAGQHKLEINDDGNIFAVHLMLTLKTN
ncbi:sensor histidine kinase [Chitinophaga ginsengisoli]|uniref:Histidine kinase n=1 Tax=Chitinophaga ginsengisoli TaxID=363837 RepID=A0A2P8GH49_9BACT|nr:sensor histidine kinase [Chitinophaga ginsengisoli]PSL33296.1 histidine kinase [Chitinophaga ginsengisoli]